MGIGETIRPADLPPSSTLFTTNSPRPVRVALTVHDQRGRCVRGLLDSELPAGEHAVAWGGTSDKGGPAASGTQSARPVTELGTRWPESVLARGLRSRPFHCGGLDHRREAVLIWTPAVGFSLAPCLQE